MTNLSILPDVVRESACKVAIAEGEVLLGWRAITVPVPDNRVRPKAYQIVTDKGIYEIDLDGIVYRASVLHQF